MKSLKSIWPIKQSARQAKGITLVALIITIIVLLILAMVSISLIMNEGIISKSKSGVDKYSEEEIGEQIKLAYTEHQMSQYTNEQLTFQQALDKVFGTNEATVTPTQTNGEYTVAFTGGKAFTFNSTTGEVTPANSSSGGSSTPATNTAYAVGQEVTVGGESFYVLEASDSTQSTVTLLAKYNLNQAGTAQAPNASYNDTKCVFSSDNYWASAHASYTDWSTKRLDINEVSGEVEGDAIYKAKAYATSKGGTNGRLLTYEEADSLKTSYGDMIWGKANQQGEGSSDYYLYYWLSSAHEDYDRGVWFVSGDYSDFYNNFFNSVRVMGVRPVITVSKSLVS